MVQLAEVEVSEEDCFAFRTIREGSVRGLRGRSVDSCN